MGMTISPNVRYASQMTAHAPAADTAAVVTLAAPGVGKRHVVSKIDVSYSGTVAAAGLTITGLDTGTYAVVWAAAEAFHQIAFDPPLRGLDNTAVVITATDPGNAAGTAKLNVVHAK